MPDDDFSPQLGLPYLLPNQVQKHVTLNESLRWLDALTMAVVEAVGVETPPTEPAAGMAYITGPEPSGDWQFAPNQFVVFQDGGWLAKSPRPGWRVWDRSQDALRVFDGEDWPSISSEGTVPEQADRFGIATQPSADVPFQARLNAALFTTRSKADGGTGDIRISLNKEAPENTASLLFQSGWTGHAELALAGGNRFGIRLSSDGTSWFDGLALDPANSSLETPFDVVPSEDAGQDLGRADRAFRDLFLANAPQVLSDARFKTEIAPLNSAENLLAALRPVKYRKGRRPEVHFGFVAQDIKAALEGCGEGGAAMWRLSDPCDPNSAQMIRPAELIAVLVGAVQALSRRLDCVEGKHHAVSDD